MTTVTRTPAKQRTERLQAAAADAKAAEARGDNDAANDAWRRYSLIANAGRPAEDLIADALALMRVTDRVQRITPAQR